MIVVDEDRFVAAVRARAAAEPDKVYTPPTVIHVNDDGDESEVEGACVYVERNDDDVLVGSCLLGCALIDAGVDPAVLDVGELGIDDLVCQVVVSMRTDVLHWAIVVQSEQDTGIPWGRAVEEADTKAGLTK
ncbi:hypothetical protein [Rhodococcus jostii]|uniref:hypothetical protein n=1 Tax=Rhodococcus jostii TaxID=132919 RepID=UPI00362914CD